MSPERMSRRARFYMAVVAGRHLAMGIIAFVAPLWFTLEAFAGMQGLLGFLSARDAVYAWGGLFITAGALAAVPAVTGRDDQARTGLLVSIVVTSASVGSCLVAARELLTPGGVGVGVVLAVLLGVLSLAVGLKDASMIAQPLRNPFERVIREELSATDAHGG